MASTEDRDYVLVNVILLSGAGAGKSTLFHRYFNYEFSDHLPSTIDVHNSIKTMQMNGHFVKLQVWDTSSQPRHQPIVEPYMQLTHGAVLLFDITNPESFKLLDSLYEWYTSVISRTVPMVVVGTKADLESHRKVLKEEAHAWCKKRGIDTYVEVSAKSDANVTHVFETMVHKVMAAMPIEQLLKKSAQIAQESIVKTMKSRPTVICDAVIIGGTSSGKTCLVQKYVEREYSESRFATIGCNAHTKVLDMCGYDMKLALWDAAGNDAGIAKALSLLFKVQVCVFVCDLSHRDSLKTLEAIYKRATLQKNPSEMFTVVLGTKADHRVLSAGDLDKWCKEKHIETYMEVSAKTGHGVDDAFKKIAELCLWTKLLLDGQSPKPNVCMCKILTDRESVQVEPSGRASFLYVVQRAKTLGSISIALDDSLDSEDWVKLETALSSNPAISELLISGSLLGTGGEGANTLITVLLSRASGIKKLSVQGHSLGPSAARTLAGNSPRALGLSLQDLSRGGVALQDAALAAVGACASLADLCLVGVIVDATAAKAFASVLPKNTSIKRLAIRGCRIEDAAAEAIFASLKKNDSLAQIDIMNTTMGNEAWKEFASMLAVNASIQNASVSDNGLTIEAGKAICEALKTNTSVSVLDLSNNSFGGDFGRSLGDALKVNSTLQGLNCANCEIGPVGGVPLVKALGANASLQRVNISSNGLNPSVGHALASALKINSSLTEVAIFENDFSKAVLHSLASLLKQEAILKRQLKREADVQLFLELDDAPLVRPKLFVCGGENTGKTTLVGSLRRSGLESIFKTTHKRHAAESRDRTVGVDVSLLKTPGTGDEFSVWDFSGEPEFASMHELFMCDENAIFMVVCCLEDEEAVREATLTYWLTFIKTRFASVDHKPQVVLVGTCADCAPSGVVKKAGDQFTADWGTHYLLKARNKLSAYIDLIGQFYAVDARRSQSPNIRSLRDCLHVCHKVAVSRAPKVPRVCAQVLASLHDLNTSETNVMNLTEFREFLQKSSLMVSEDQVEKYIETLLKYFASIGEVVWFSDDEELSEIVIVNPRWLCSSIIGPILASLCVAAGTHKYRDVSGDMERVFKGQDAAKTIVLLTKLGLSYMDDSDAKNPAFILPAALLDTDRRPADVWAPSWDFDVRFGRRWLCCSDLDVFTPGFFPKFQVYAQTQLQRHGIVWKGGFFFGVRGQYECLVQMGSDNKHVDVCMRTNKKHASEAAVFMNHILDALEHARHSSCAGTFYTVLALSPSGIKDGCTVAAGFRVEDVLRSVRDKTPLHPVHPAETAAETHGPESASDILGPRVRHTEATAAAGTASPRQQKKREEVKSESS